MQIRVLANTLVNGVWHEPGVGNYDPSLAQHLIDIGVAEAYETKIVTVEVTKAKKPLSASQPGQVLRKKIARMSKKAN